MSAELRIVCDTDGHEELLRDYVAISELAALNPDEAARRGYIPTWSLIPEAPPEELTDERFNRLLIRPEDVDPENPDILPIRFVRIPRILGELAHRATDSPTLAAELTEQQIIMTGITSLKDFRWHNSNLLTTTRDLSGRYVGLHIDSLPDENVHYLIANHSAAYSRWHCLSDYLVRRGDELYGAAKRVKYIQAHPPTKDDEALWLCTPPSELVTWRSDDGQEQELRMDWAVLSPVARVAHDGSTSSLGGASSGSRYGVAPTPGSIMSMGYILEADLTYAAAIPAPFYPRDSDKVLYETWLQEQQDARQLLIENPEAWRADEALKKLRAKHAS